MKNKFSTHRCASNFSLSPFRIQAFTLIELLIVIAAIGILAAMLMPVFHAVTIHAVLQRAQSERAQLETVIDRYQKKYGFYPPGNALPTAPNLPAALTNQLYYELVGTTNIGTIAQPNFLTLDNRITNTPTLANQAFGVTAFMNLSRSGAGGEDAVWAQTFLPAIKPTQIANVVVGNGVISILCTAANSDPSYKPIPGALTDAGRPANPWRYLYPGVHNPQSYDLWIQVFIGGKTNLICNWKSDVEVNPTLP
jgi:prepilin-type N-terminal cleavage/methylation domain-containing protein